MGQYEEQAAGALLAELDAQYALLRGPLEDFIRARPLKDGGFEDAALAAADCIWAAEHLAEALLSYARMLRAKLAAAMDETGCPETIGNGLKVRLQEGRKSAEILDLSAVPAAMMRQPPPSPDRSKILKFLRKNPAANWARIATGNPFIVIERETHA